MIDTTSIGYSIFYTYGFIQGKRFAKWRLEPSTEDPVKTNVQYCIERTEKLIAMGRKEAVKLGIAELYDEWIAAEKSYAKRDASDDLQCKRLFLAQELRSLGGEN